MPPTRTFPAILPEIFRQLIGAPCHFEDFCLNRLYSGVCMEFQRHLAGEIATLHKSIRELHLHGVLAPLCRIRVPKHKVKANQLLSCSNSSSSSASIITTRSPCCRITIRADTGCSAWKNMTNPAGGSLWTMYRHCCPFQR